MIERLRPKGSHETSLMASFFIAQKTAMLSSGRLSQQIIVLFNIIYTGPTCLAKLTKFNVKNTYKTKNILAINNIRTHTITRVKFLRDRKIVIPSKK